MMRNNNTKNKNKQHNKEIAQLKNDLNALQSLAKGPSKNKKKNKKNKQKNEVREINDFPMGTSQINGFNKNAQSKIVANDEYIGEIPGTVDFSVNQYAVNPGQAYTFPWLSIEAKQWEKYEFLELEFYLKPEVTQYTQYANSGKVILSFDTDASDAPPLNKQEAEDVKPMADGMPYQTIKMTVPKYILKNHLDAFYVRPGILPGGADIKTYDLGNLFVSTVGQVDGVTDKMMELRVRYRCKLMIPILENTTFAPQNYTTACFTDEAELETGVNYQCLWGITAGESAIRADGINAEPDAYGNIQLQPGNYVVNCCTNFTNGTGNEITVARMFLYLGGYLQQTLTGECPSGYIGSATQQVTLNYPPLYLSVHSNDVISVSLQAIFAAGTTSTFSTIRISTI